MNIEKNSLVTVGIPFYSKSKPDYLKESIDSILNQSIKPYKIHLIQDGPISIELKEIIDNYKKKDSDLFEIIILNKKGLPYALNHSIRQTDTKYYARMDSDDIAFNDRLEKQIKYLETNEDVDILGSWSIEFENVSHKENGFINRRPDSKKEIHDYFHYMNPLIHPSVLFRVSVFKKIGFYNEQFYTDQDLELWGRALKNKIKISNIQEPLLYFRTEGRQKRRSRFSAVKRQIIARYSFNTLSIKLNILKIASILFRLLPEKVRLLGYKHIR